MYNYSKNNFWPNPAPAVKGTRRTQVLLMVFSLFEPVGWGEVRTPTLLGIIPFSPTYELHPGYEYKVFKL
jgi:hypothetical protein